MYWYLPVCTSSNDTRARRCRHLAWMEVPQREVDAVGVDEAGSKCRPAVTSVRTSWAFATAIAHHCRNLRSLVREQGHGKRNMLSQRNSGPKSNKLIY